MRVAHRIDRPYEVGVTGAVLESEIPQVRRIAAQHSDPIERNEAFNEAYQQLAYGIQTVVAFGPEVLPNWFAVGAYASPQVGRAMLAAERTLEAIELLGRDPKARDQVFERMQLRGNQSRIASAVATVLEAVAGSSVATAIAGFVTAMIATDRATSTTGLADPRLAIAIAYRVWNLIKPERSWLGSALDGLRAFVAGDPAKNDLLAGVGRMAATYRSLLAEGNREIFLDIGGSAEAFLRLVERRGGTPEPQDVLGSLRLPSSTAAGARRVYELALEQLETPRPITKFEGVTSQGNDLVRAAFALYALAGQTADVDRKNQLVSFANNLIAWREQFEIVQPVFTGRRMGELDRSRVLSALTPVIQVPFDGFTWTFTKYARGAGHDHNPWTAPASEYDWSRFADRWPAILHSFRTVYAHTDRIWRFPDPQVR